MPLPSIVGRAAIGRQLDVAEAGKPARFAISRSRRGNGEQRSDDALIGEGRASYAARNTQRAVFDAAGKVAFAAPTALQC